MRANNRILIGALIGLALFASGFWLMLHSSDYFNVTLAAGVQAAPHAQDFTHMAELLMGAGVCLEVLTVCLWMYRGNADLRPVAPQTRG